MKKSNEHTLKQAIDALLDAYKLKGKLGEQRMINSWEKVLGKTIAKRTVDIYIRERVLYVSLNSSVLKEELLYAKEKMIRLLNTEAGEDIIEDIVLR